MSLKLRGHRVREEWREENGLEGAGVNMTKYRCEYSRLLSAAVINN